MKRGALVSVLVTCVIGAQVDGLARNSDVKRRRAVAIARLPVEGSLPPLEGATEWLGSRPLTAAALRGKVVLVDFWTYWRGRRRTIGASHKATAVRGPE